MKRLLIIDDDRKFCSDVRCLLDPEYIVECSQTSAVGLDLIAHEAFDAVLLDIDLGEENDGLEVLQRLRTIDPDVPVIMVSRSDDPSVLVRSGRYGASDFVVKGSSFDGLSFRLRKALDARAMTLRDELRAWESQSDDGWHAESERGLEVTHLINTFAPTDSPVLITGPTGCGKDVVARSLHARSLRAKEPFVAVNCAAIPDELAESSFFGHEKGSFTGAIDRRRGCFELATTGTLFLDEFVEMRSDLQAKLLRVIERGEIRRLGSEQVQRVNPRIIAATNHSIDAALETGRLREDVYYRLATLTIDVPPLTERRADIVPIGKHFAAMRALKDGKEPPDISPQAVAVLMSYEWPGNLRELRNVIERAVLFCASNSIQPNHLTGLREGFQHVEQPYKAARAAAVGRFERDYMATMLTLTDGSVTQAADRVGMTRQGVHKILRKYGIEPSRYHRPNDQER